MMLIIPPKQKHTEEKKEVTKEGEVYVMWKKNPDAKAKTVEAAPAAKPKDWAYMEMSGQVLRNPPETWKVYPDNEEGKRAIIDMEYHELQNAIAINAPKEDIMRELVHLGSATLAMWRELNAAE